MSLFGTRRATASALGATAYPSLMGRLLRYLSGVLLIVVAVAIGLRYGEPAYVTLYGEPAYVTVGGPCTADRFLIIDQVTRCQGHWTDGGTERSGVLTAADRPAEGETVTARVFAGDAFVRPTGASLILGYATVPLGLIGLYLAFKGRRRGQRSGRRDDPYSGYSGDDNRDDSDSGYESGGDSGGGDSGGDSGGND
jgi:hypothetical protein